MTDDSPGQVRPFATVLQDLRKGAVLEEAAAELQQLVASVLETGKKGKLTLVVAIEPMKGNETALTVAADVTTTRPKSPPKAAVFFADSEFNLVRDDPRQIALPGLRRIDTITISNEPKDIAQ
ncbi:hypothetical protein OG884_26675 [Streptosporangium sp. NBC_01755]|uniref:hypothetical protein n=1 Tax=Streptosporangium sp. NBC_01755 TaxID=2975949 RepID=UPI002DDB2C6E|nr:hypothetical protein [Streptosporangium sp. NBC_01755]WSC98435.1 hypothetical protein OG884_26675 [Streptosporangium sp. NBC_01755]